MVKIFTLVALTLVLSTSRAEVSGPVKFKMEFSKPEIYYGEQVLCHFNVFTHNDLIEVEVAKFPEFRGFWNENLVLRQGPLATLFGLNLQPQVATVGTYVLIPMLGQTKPTIEPMKIVLRTPALRRVEGSTPPDFVLSEGVALTIKPLPPIPTNFPQTAFVGAVGKFNSSTEPVTVSFQPGEPAMLQISIMGQGNFPEINRLPIDFPPSVEIVSQRAYLQGASQSGSKTFEYQLTLKDAAEFSIPATPFLYFDPDFKKYSKIELPEIHFKKMEGISERVAADKSQQLPSFEFQENISVEKRKRSTLPLWFLNAVGFFLFLVALLWKAKAVVVQQRKFDEMGALYQRAERALDASEAKSFLSALESYVYAWICEKACIREAGVPRREVLKLADTRLTAEQKRLALELTELCESQLYRPRPETSPDLSNLRKSVLEAFPPPKRQMTPKTA